MHSVVTGDAVLSLGSLLTKGMMGSQNKRRQVAVLKDQKQGRYNYSQERQSWDGSQEELTCRQLWKWLTEHSVPGGQVDRQPTRFKQSKKDNPEV